MAPQVQFGFCADLNWKYLLGRSRHSQSVARQRPTRSARECETHVGNNAGLRETYTAQQINPLLERQQNEIETSSQIVRKALETAEEKWRTPARDKPC